LMFGRPASRSLILIHEMGHFIDIKRPRACRPRCPSFLPGLGRVRTLAGAGASRSKREPQSAWPEPLAGFFSSALGLCRPMVADRQSTLGCSGARAGAVLKPTQLSFPSGCWMAAKAALALSKTERIVLLTACLALLAGAGAKNMFLPGSPRLWISSLLRRTSPRTPQPRYKRSILLQS